MCLMTVDCRYAVFDFEYEAEGVTRNKILFVVWYVAILGAPDHVSGLLNHQR